MKFLVEPLDGVSGSDHFHISRSQRKKVRSFSQASSSDLTTAGQLLFHLFF